jgi:microcystin-dependent protein
MSQPFVGEIIMFGGNFAPAGWAMCDGQLMPISENDTLFNLIGTTYGGDGQETFAMPDLQGRVPVHNGTGSDGINYQIGEKAGVESVTLSTQQIPSHSHVSQTASGGQAATAPNNILADAQTNQAGTRIYSSQAPSVALNNNTVTIQGGSQPHDNIQQTLCVTYVISLFGIYPSQN